MTVNERYELSCYEELKKLKEHKEVYLVRHNTSGVMGVKKYLKWYNEEVYKVLKSCRFPGMPRILFCAKEEDTLVVVEEYIEGKTLTQMLEDVEKIKQNSALDIILHLCEILEPLHQCNPPIIHRDIKPSNIMITKDYRLCLIDFNAAKQISERHEDTVLLGTKEYAAPEQYGFGSSDIRTDIYALGILLNVMVTGEYPKNQRADGKLGEIIAKATALNPDERYSSVVAFAKELVAYERMCSESGAKYRSAVHERKNKLPYRLVHTKSKYMAYKSKDDKKTEKSNWQKWLPVGFRTKTIWKMILATAMYWLIYILATQSDFRKNGGVIVSGAEHVAYEIYCFVVFLFPIFFYGNYGNVRYQLPWMRKNKWLHWILSVVYFLAFELLFSVVWILIMMILFS